MAEEQMTPEQIVELQKKNCPFCKIVKKELDAKVVYEDEKIIVLMDIYPAAKGHILVMPKEHYYILPLIPPEVFDHMFRLSKKLIKAIKDALIVPDVSIFIASGPAAGQQGSHTLFHIIPREEGDGLDILDVNERKEEQKDIIPQAKSNITAVFQQYFQKKAEMQKEKREQLQAPKEEKPVHEDDEAEGIIKEKDKEVEKIPNIDLLSQIIYQTPELKNLIITSPEMVKNYVDKSPKLSKLFQGVNIFALSDIIKKQEEEKKLKEIPRAEEISDEELYEYVEGKEKLKEWILESPEQLKEIIPKQKGLAKFFEGSDPDEIIRRYLKMREKHG